MTREEIHEKLRAFDGLNPPSPEIEDVLDYFGWYDHGADAYKIAGIIIRLLEALK